MRHSMLLAWIGCGAMLVATGCGKPSQEYGIRLELRETSLGGLPQPPAWMTPERLKVSPDSRHVAWFHQGSLRIDGRQIGRFDNGIGPSLEFSPDSRHLVCLGYVMQQGKRRFAIAVDGRPGPAYDKISHEIWRGLGIRYGTFNADGSRYRYRAEQDGKPLHVTVDLDTGKHVESDRPPDEPAWEDPTPKPRVSDKPPPGFKVDPESEHRPSWYVSSPDGKRVVCWVRGGEGIYCVVDGNVAPPGKFRERVVFSADSRRVAYVARTKDGGRIVVDGRGGPVWKYLINRQEPAFSPDGRYVAYMAPQNEDVLRRGWVILVNDLRTGTYDSALIRHGARILFDGPDALHTIMVRDGEALLVEVNIIPDPSAPKPPE